MVDATKTALPGESNVTAAPRADNNNIAHPMAPDDTSFDIVASDYPHDEPAPPLSALEALCRPPGLVGDIVDWIEECAMLPSRPLALGPVLCFLGTLAGRVTAGPTSLRTNLYVVGLAASGYGKDHPRKCISQLATATGLDRFMGPETFLSDSAMRKTVEHHPSLFCMIDEFGGFISKMMDKNAGNYQKGMRQMLLSLYSQSGDVYRGAASAAEQHEPIFNPCLSFYGTSTPHDFWPAMSGAGVADGFLPRFLLLNIPGQPPEDERPWMPLKPSNDLVKRCKKFFQDVRPGNLAKADAMTGRIDPAPAKWGAGAEECYRHWKKKCREYGRNEPDFDMMWTRTMENALKVAHIVTLGVDPAHPKITGALMEWGVELAALSTRTAIEQVRDRLSNNDKQAEYLKARRFIKATGRKGATARDVGRAFNGTVDLPRRASILNQLVEEGHVVKLLTGNPHGGPKSDRYFAVQFCPEATES